MYNVSTGYTIWFSFAQMKSNTQQIIIHITGCIIFLALPILFSPAPSSSFDILNNPPSQRDFIGYVLLIGFFYLNFFILIPHFYFTKKYEFFFLITLACFALIILIPDLVTNHNFGAHPPPKSQGISPNHFPPPPGKPEGSDFFFEIFQHLLLFLVVFFFSLMIRISNRWKQTEKEKLNAEVSFLKAQINPHFLFNTLNSIYALAIEKDDKTADAVVQLSELMRYIIRDANDEMVALQKEINYISNYIALQKTRLGDTVIINYHVQGNTAGLQIAPLILISFIENAFKHGVNPDKNSIIEISIAVLENNLRLYIFNRKTSSLKEQQGIGLQNSTDRLNLLYPSKHELVIDNKEESYTVHLLITLQ
jgi:histidine kinase